MRTIRDQTPRRHSACSDRFLAELFRGPYHMLYHHLRPCCCLLFSQTRCLVEPATTCSSGPSSVWQMLTCCPPPPSFICMGNHTNIFITNFSRENERNAPCSCSSLTRLTGKNPSNPSMETRRFFFRSHPSSAEHGRTVRPSVGDATTN